MSTKIQRRAICPICFRQQAITGSVMVQHGYVRPQGYHANLNDCRGVYQYHFGTPEGRDRAASEAIGMRQHAARLRESAEETRIGVLTLKDRKNEIIENPMPWQIDQQVSRLLSDATFIEKQADVVDEAVVNWTAQEPVEVIVEAKKATLVHFLRPRWGKACAASMTGARSGRTTKDTSEVTCDKCKKTHIFKVETGETTK